MHFFTRRRLGNWWLLACFSMLFSTCVDPVTPEYNNLTGLLFVDAYCLSDIGTSYVKLQSSELVSNRYVTAPVSGAVIKVIDQTGNTTIPFTESDPGEYVCPADFAGEPGHTFQLSILLPDGREFLSESEAMPQAVPVTEVRADFNPELYYSDARKKYIPGHRIVLDWQDPAGVTNYYLWRYKSYEPLAVCVSCENGVFRNGACISQPPRFGSYTYDYLCLGSCWQIRYDEAISVFSDEFYDGGSITDRAVLDIPLYRKENILVEFKQLSISAKAYHYFQVLTDITGNSGGLNAPPPAALLGNIYNPDDDQALILGQFTVAGVTSKSIFIERRNVASDPVTKPVPVRLEPLDPSPPQAPCINGRYRTPNKPKDWPG